MENRGISDCRQTIEYKVMRRRLEGDEAAIGADE